MLTSCKRKAVIGRKRGFSDPMLTPENPFCMMIFLFLNRRVVSAVIFPQAEDPHEWIFPVYLLDSSATPNVFYALIQEPGMKTFYERRGLP